MRPAHSNSYARLLISTHCTHCKTVLAHFTDMIKEGVLGRLEIDNVDQFPEIAKELNVRSLPWFQIGPFELTGAMTRGELENWLKKSSSEEGMADYFAELMQDRQVEKVISLIEDKQELFPAIVRLLGDPDTEITVKIGIGVVMETFQGKKPLSDYFEQLEPLTHHQDPRVRADSSHYLGLTEDRRAFPILQAMLDDEDANVRESVADTLDDISQIMKKPS